MRHYVGIFGPPGLPTEVAEKLNKEINEILRDPDVDKAFKAQGDLPTPVSLETFAQTVSSDAKIWGGLAREMNLSTN
ncbi:hypothetical protein CR155_20440 [Pollutimonas nitritireducens]|uniref:Uncharacterized protein n=1 Tax=Pollutimonas nitritireducens TaxID=2045209 RepID=A0A2N4UAG1_9BURK|nr:tripartite tricarboxylate transporter substrate-binding protein [Pollutimonas nitritireducens]PLC51997.1 hypothetical protein CR155_20440 [Pollutimonas nitritireducens]